MITLVSVLKSVDKANVFESYFFEMCKCESLFFLSKHLTVIYLYSKR